MDQKKPSIHFVLPGGGPKGCFQAGFLYQLFTKYRNFFELHQIDGTSVGALNGYVVACRQLDMLQKVWLDINSISDIFTPFSNLPVVGMLYTAYCAFHQKGCMTNKKMMEIAKTIDVTVPTDLNRFQCVVTDLLHGNALYVKSCDDENCEHPRKHKAQLNVKITDMSKYVVASASPWILVAPVVIEDYSYTDGALLAQYPIKNIKTTTADLVVVVGHYEDAFSAEGTDGSHILHFMARLVEICWQHSNNVKDMKELIDTNKVILVSHALPIDFLDFKNDTIKNGFNIGKKEADIFAERYLIKENKYRPRSSSL